MLFDLLIPLVLYRLAPNRERLLRVLRPMFLSEQIPEDMAEITEAVFQHVHIEPEMPRNVTKEEMARFTAPTLILAGGKDRLFPAHQVITRARQVLPGLIAGEVIAGSPHFISPRFYPQLNQRIDEFLTETRRENNKGLES